MDQEGIQTAAQSRDSQGHLIRVCPHLLTTDRTPSTLRVHRLRLPVPPRRPSRHTIIHRLLRKQSKDDAHAVRVRRAVVRTGACAASLRRGSAARGRGRLIAAGKESLHDDGGKDADAVAPTPVGYTASSRTLAVATGARHEVGSAAWAWAGSRALFEGAGRGAPRARRALDGEHSPRVLRAGYTVQLMILSPKISAFFSALSTTRGPQHLDAAQSRAFHDRRR